MQVIHRNRSQPPRQRSVAPDVTAKCEGDLQWQCCTPRRARPASSVRDCDGTWRVGMLRWWQEVRVDQVWGECLGLYIFEARTTPSCIIFLPFVWDDRLAAAPFVWLLCSSFFFGGFICWVVCDGGEPPWMYIPIKSVYSWAFSKAISNIRIFWTSISICVALKCLIKNGLVFRHSLTFAATKRLPSATSFAHFRVSSFRASLHTSLVVSSCGCSLLFVCAHERNCQRDCVFFLTKNT